MNTHETNDAQVKPDGAAIAPFRREERYLVFKRKDCEACMTTAEREQLIELARKMWAYRKDAGKSDFDCVVVESDWPEYEPAWAAIETRMTGRALTAAEKPEAVELGTFTGQIEKCESHPTPVLTGETPFPLSEDISLAYEWCNASKVFESPGNGEGWRHTCLRLAQEVERQQKELTAERAEAERLAARQLAIYKWCERRITKECEDIEEMLEHIYERLTGANEEAERLRERVAELERIESHLCKELGGEIEARDVNAKYCTEAREENARLRSELAIRDTEMQVQAELCDRLAAALRESYNFTCGYSGGRSDKLNKATRKTLDSYAVAIATRAAGPAVAGGGRENP